MVCLDDAGEVVRPALLWNDTRSAGRRGRRELGRRARRRAGVGRRGRLACRSPRSPSPSCAGSPSTSPQRWPRTAAVCLPHDWLTWRLRRRDGLGALVTDRSDASGTGYWSPATGEYRPDLLQPALAAQTRSSRRCSARARVGGRGRDRSRARRRDRATTPPRRSASAPARRRGRVDRHLRDGVRGQRRRPTADPTGTVAGFADATGDFLPLVCTLNAARVLDARRRCSASTTTGSSELALAAPPGAGGLVAGAVPRGRAHAEPAGRHRRAARAAPCATRPRRTWPGPRSKGMLCGLADGLDALIAHGRHRSAGCILIGGGARSDGGPQDRPGRASAARSRCRRRASTSPTAPPGRPPGRYPSTATPPHWATSPSITIEAKSEPAIRERYHETCGTVAAG